MRDYLKVIVTGEVDSGKSTLIGRFLYETGSLSQGTIEEIADISQRLDRDFEFAYLLDSFEEERRNQLTIDTAQVFCKTKRGIGLIFIDVPGHRELLKNMLSGSSYADIAILVVDVQKSIEEQTRRHAFILKFLGIEQIILALNKMDSVNFDENTFERVKEDAVGLIKKVGIEPKYFIPVSAKQGENLCKESKKMPWYRGLPLAEILNLCFKETMNGDFRFSVQDIYRINGEKVAIGKIISGNIRNGEKVKILPINKECNIKTIRVFDRNRAAAKAPESIGLVLDEMSGLERGQIICKPALPHVVREVLAKIFCVQPFDIKESMRFKCTTQDVSVRIKQITGIWDIATLEAKSVSDSLGQFDLAEAVLVTDSPVVVEGYKQSNSLGRFILKDNIEIRAVGIIL